MTCIFWQPLMFSNNWTSMFLDFWLHTVYYELFGRIWDEKPLCFLHYNVNSFDFFNKLIMFVSFETMDVCYVVQHYKGQGTHHINIILLHLILLLLTVFISQLYNLRKVGQFNVHLILLTRHNHHILELNFAQDKIL